MKMPTKLKIDLLKTDFKRMDLMLKSFKRIGKHERAWFIKRLSADHFDLLEKEILLEKAKP